MKKLIIAIVVFSGVSLYADNSLCLTYAVYMKGPGHYLEKEARCEEILKVDIPYRISEAE